MHEFPDIISLDPKVLIQLVLIVSLSALGLCEFFKNFIKASGPKHDHVRAGTLVIVIIICSYFNTILVPPLVTTVFDTIALSLAITQLGYDTLLKGIPKLIQGMLDRVANSVSKEG